LAGCFLARESGLRGADDPVKTTKLIAGFPAALVAVLSAQAQGTFQNLNFEQADPVPIVGSPYYPYAVTPGSALPGWTGSIGGVPVTQVFLNDVSLGAASIDLLGPGNTLGVGVIDGNYSVYLQPGTSLQGTGSYSTSLAQVGTIPSTAESLTFDAWQPMYATPFSVSFAGDTLSPVVLSTGVSPSGQAYDVYGVNIASFAGQNGQLEFTVYPPWNNSLLLDDISFSTNAPTPEPSIVALTAIGGLLFGARKWFARRG
jgi:hypothetical protein